MTTIRRRANAKINVFLRVLGRRSDGFHDIETLILPLELHDVVEAGPADTLEVEVHGARAAELAGAGGEGLASTAARFLADACSAGHRHGARISIEKHIPVAAGLGGGSADAAAALLALRELWSCEIDDDRRDGRTRPEHRRRNLPHDRRAGSRGDADADGAVALVAGRRGEPLADLPLHHHERPRDRRHAGEHVEHQRGRDVVREVRAQHPRALAGQRPRPVEAHHVGLEHRDAIERRDDLAERRDEAAIELNREHLRAGRGERQRERPEPGADLNHAIASGDAGVGGDRARQVRIDQEVLAERLRGADAVTPGELPDRAGAQPIGRRGRRRLAVGRCRVRAVTRRAGPGGPLARAVRARRRPPARGR